MPKIIFILADGTRQEIDANVGDTVLDGARAGNVPLAGACMGSMVCCTCRVEVDSAWLAKLPAPEPREEAALESICEATETSRLACAIKITEDLNGLIVRIP
ncbi:MAG: 2Fe-2S iron-sulfur cluster binding domain-containing protein [Holosporales bacterium]|jgi:ferredoxin|nr:2Fe-2S iron-sulfur cluster binding domain-containing protein [Holosporales bacterium]